MRKFIFLWAISAPAQNLSLGVVGGFSPKADTQNDIVSSTPSSPGFTNFSTPRHYLVGLSLEYRFTAALSIEADGLYHPLRYTFAGIEPDGSLNSVSPATVITWEFPVLAKYRFINWGVHPFIEAGPSFRTAGNLNSANPSHVGVTGGVGIETHAGRIGVTPAIRYTRWEPDPQHAVRTVSDQMELVVGFNTAAESSWHPLSSRILIGAIAGTNLIGDFRPQTQSYTTLDGETVENFTGPGPRSLQGGALIEVTLRGNLSIESDLIYESLKGNSRTRVTGTPPAGLFLGSGNFVFTESEWKFPVLAKYRFLEKRWSPIAELGPSFRIPNGATLSWYGTTAGLGLEHRWRRFQISPALRYTRWAGQRMDVDRGRLNQLDLVTGFSF